jgi:hypothetical protein
MSPAAGKSYAGNGKIEILPSALLLNNRTKEITQTKQLKQFHRSNQQKHLTGMPTICGKTRGKLEG